MKCKENMKSMRNWKMLNENFRPDISNEIQSNEPNLNRFSGQLIINQIKYAQSYI
jgi:hypothetical protein